MDEIQTKVVRVFLIAFHQSPLQLGLEISLSSNFLQFLQFSYCIVYTAKEKGGKPDRENLTTFPMV